MAKSPSIATSILLLLIALHEDFIICQGLISTTMLIYLSCPGRIHFSLPGCSPQHVNPATSLGEIVSIALCSSCTSTHPQSQQELITRVCKIPSAPLGKCSSAILLFIYVFLILIFIDYNWHTTLCKFKVYSVLISCIYILQHDDRHGLAPSLPFTQLSLPFRGENIYDLVGGLF